MPPRNKTSNLTDIAWVELVGSVHATENREKVLTAFRNLLPPTMDDVSFQQTTLRGYHGNPVIFLSLRIKKRTHIINLLRNLANALDLVDKQTLTREFLERMDADNIFYLKVDKQKAYWGEPVLAQGDNTILIKVKIRQYVKDPEKISEKLADLGLIEA